MQKFLIVFPGNENLVQHIKDFQKLKVLNYEIRKFPDGETYIRFLEDVNDADIVVLCSLHAPDDKFLPLIFLAETARQQGAKSVGLISPYLPYMRQDHQFKQGESITSSIFAEIISSYFNWLITTDPHLHRYENLDEIYSIPAVIQASAKFIAKYISANIQNALIIGPDEESKQWVSEVAKLSGSSYIVLKKERLGDKNVRLTYPNFSKFKNHTPVLVDDIISTANTMMEIVKHLQTQINIKPICIGVHAVFSENAYNDLLHAGAQKIVTCNTIQHFSNEINIVYEINDFE